MDVPPGSPDGAYPPSLVYTDHPIPSFQLSICPNFAPRPFCWPQNSPFWLLPKWQHPFANIYSLCPIMESQILSTSFTVNSFGSSSPQRT
ncbi:unnamed protein product [Nyctereutes procyonoides]|uniref:(raccoon dog) hypothetical protein n=1 Tax=Nyctereutes procyonoides TaxID=34880 RepID=A0A811Y369_NYCPR|nr:unnamed protein product [Nyctereutes procyonoides]